MDDSDFDDIARSLGLPLGSEQRALLVRYERWLIEEAIPAGGLGPAEAGRVRDRHVADSLVFAAGLPDDPGHVADIGGGVGLPSIPLAVVLPNTRLTLVDRSSRRTDLAARAVRILGLSNLEIVTEDVMRHRHLYDAVLFRASLRIPEAAQCTLRCTPVGGRGVVGVSRRRKRPDVPSAPDGITFELTSEAALVLDSPSWLLRMHHV